jgi:hypothetical protein
MTSASNRGGDKPIIEMVASSSDTRAKDDRIRELEAEVKLLKENES